MDAEGGAAVTPLELKRCRIIYRSLSLRMNIVRTKLRIAVIKDDVLCLDLKGGSSLDDDTVAVPAHIVGARIRA
jgi:hypothetical protein